MAGDLCGVDIVIGLLSHHRSRITDFRVSKSRHRLVWSSSHPSVVDVVMVTLHYVSKLAGRGQVSAPQSDV